MWLAPNQKAPTTQSTVSTWLLDGIQEGLDSFLGQLSTLYLIVQLRDECVPSSRDHVEVDLKYFDCFGKLTVDCSLAYANT